MVGSASAAQIRIAFTNGQETRALLRVTLRFAPKAWKTVLTVGAALAELFAEIL